jgi:DNA-binding SARP family transcriptional activator
MRILAQCGRRTAALKQYDRCCQVLEQELATEPEPATIALWEAIRTRTFPVSTSAESDRVKLQSISAVSKRSVRESLAVVGR